MRNVVLFAFLYGFWLLWSGHYTPWLMGSGAGCCVVVILLSRRMGTVDAEGVPYQLIPGMLLYVPWLVWEVVKANVDVVRRVLSPRLPISPRVIVVETSQHADVGRVVYANSITLTPGTVSIEAEGGRITVHALSAEGAADIASGRMDARVTRAEGRG